MGVRQTHAVAGILDTSRRTRSVEWCEQPSTGPANLPKQRSSRPRQWAGCSISPARCDMGRRFASILLFGFLANPTCRRTDKANHRRPMIDSSLNR